MQALIRQLKARLWPGNAVARGASPAATDGSADALAHARQLVTQGNTLEDAGDLAGALERYRQAVQAAPRHPEAHLNLGIGLAATGDAAGATQAYEAVLALDANHPFGNYNYANLVYANGDLARAEELLRRALASRPDFPQAHVQLANVLDERGDAAGAEQSFRASLALKPDYPGAHYNLAMLLWRQQKPAEALRSAEQAAALEPDNLAANALLGRLLVENGLGVEALAPVRKAIALAPDNMELRSRELFLMNLDESVQADALFQQHRDAGALLEQSVPPRFAGAWHGNPDPQRRLRVGFVSGDFRVHPVSLFLLPVLERRDRAQFEFFCYSRVEAADHITARVRELADRWVEAASLTNPELAAAIHADAIDVLVDLQGHTSNYALPALCEQPAPVQVSWMGYLNTSGLTRIGYRLCDVRGDPPAQSAPLHTEELVALPVSQWCYRPFFETPLLEEAPHVRNGAVTFGSFNAATKITDAMCERWARIVQKVPDSRLLVAGITSPAKQAAVLAALQRGGLPSDRARFAERVTLDEYLKLIATVDIALDSYPYGGGTTTFDALYMGVPVLTATGATPASRSAASILSGLGLDDWIAGSIEEYEQLAIERAADRETITRLRASLRSRLQGSGFMAEERFVHDLEATLRGLWRRYCEGVAPAA